MRFHSQPKTPIGLTILAISGVLGLAYFNQNFTEPQRIRELNKDLYSLVEGSDGVQSVEEKRKALRGLGFGDYNFEKAESIKFVPNEIRNEIEIYVYSKEGDRYLGVRSLVELENYLDSAKK